ncbi:CHD3-type chromatin-remodeling factor PICKLE-like [Lolium rigidum]|uniref:CHD3-type chromatin-remodeling factor PICKLE-like n=1 Tax=Lolium rigidum TaxID=89674 RepID=UPI001F5DC898|nr:CHD3-type chromatin-remodeling factor PICKLE-like [Lolium rigidum]
MLPPSRRSKRLQRKLTGKDDLIGTESEDVSVSREDESRKLVQQRRPKRLRKKLLSEYYSGEVTDDKGTWRSSPDDDDHLPPQRRSKRLRDRVGTRNYESDDEADSDTIGKSQKLVQQRRPKRLRKKLLSEYYNVEVSEDKDTWQGSSDDDDHLPPQRRSKRLQERVGTRIHESDDDADSDTIDNHRKAIPCRMSKRLQEKRKADHISDESYTEASSCMLSVSSSSGSDDELLRNTVNPCKNTSDGPMCSICKSGTGSSFLIECQNSSCSHSFHSFCLHPPMQNSGGTLECPLCNSNQTSLAQRTEVNPSRKIQRFVGCRRVILQESDFQYQFLVKWHLLSHHHDCWVPLDWLLVHDRLRAQSYIRKNSLPKEVFSDDERKPEWFEVDRAIACRRKFEPHGLCDILASFEDNEDFEGYEFLVKWKGLDYCDATWEPYSTEGVQSAISMLVERHRNTLKRADCISQMYTDEMIPENVHSGALYDYQLQGLQWIFDNFKIRRSVILADEMGLGKTVQVVSFLSHIIKGSFTTSPALVLAPKSILLQWKKEFGRWASDLNIVVYQGDKDSRKCIQDHEMYSSEGRTLFDALVTSYEFVQLDKEVLQKIKWSTIVIDEAHRLKKVDCNLASVLKRYSSEFRLLLTGTPLQNNILELFSLLHYIDPDEFSDAKADGLFLPIECGLDLTIDEKVARIHEILKPRMLRRMKSDVLKDSMPIKKWVEVPCALTDSQRDLYINILEKNYSKLNSAIQSGRKLSLNNYLFPGLEVHQRAGEDVFLSLVSASGKLQLLHKLLPKLKERGNRVLIFSQMTKMLDILEDFLFSLGYKYARIDGQTSLSARQEGIKEYNNVESETFIFLMSTRAGGLGIDLPGADRVIIYDPDFNPFMDLQAQSRAHRIGQTRPVVVYQLITKCSVEEKILQKSKQKLAIENMLMNSSKKPSAEELKSVLLHGAKTILEKKKINATSIHYDDEAIENLLKLDPSIGEKCSSEDNGYLGSIVSFAHGGEEEGPLSPKVEDLKVFKPATPKVELLGRGRRQRLAVKYSDDLDIGDSDDMYAPEVSPDSSSSSSDDETEQEIPEVVSLKQEVAPDSSSSSSDDETEQEIPEVVSLKQEVAPVPDSQLTSSLSSSDGEKENVTL